MEILASAVMVFMVVGLVVRPLWELGKWVVRRLLS